MATHFGIPVDDGNQGIVPGSGAFGLDWPASGAIPESYSAGGWTDGNEGFVQQTFLGASIRSFNVTGGFGDSSSSCSVQLVNDEYNVSDKTGLGAGDDVYHNGAHDLFIPPPVGTPVFFKFGKNHATVEQAWRQLFDDTYTYETMPPVPNQDITSSDNIYSTTGASSFAPKGEILAQPEHDVFLDLTQHPEKNVWIDKRYMYDANYQWDVPVGFGTEPRGAGRGRDHFVFGGILQSYTQNRSTGGNPLYSVNIADPREILSNATMILNNYGGTTFNNKNLFNVFGFLEYDTTNALSDTLEDSYDQKVLLNKYVNPTTGAVTYSGDDLYSRLPDSPPNAFSATGLPNVFPVTGKGFSRRSDKGIPLYRVLQAMSALLEETGRLPDEYREAGFGGFIDFRGFNYIVDFGGIPIEKIPDYYFMDFDQINLLEFAQELCEILSHDMFVSLLPIIQHPESQFLYEWNNYAVLNEPHNIVAGIIRVDAIDRSVQPSYGTIKTYIDTLDDRGILVENQDIGFELSNIVTDKFIVGAQEVEMHYFSGNSDRGAVELRKSKAGLINEYDFLLGDQWYLHNTAQQQILPFYGFLGKDAVTIPRGWGSYQQILLDATSLNADGVGNYYIATELELRCAALSYKDWKDFLLQYNDTYMESMRASDTLGIGTLVRTVAQGGTTIDPELTGEYGVSVPRCVWKSDRNYMGPDGLPASPCSPPFGYPLYYKRSEKIGIPEAGIAKIAASKTQLITNLAKLKSKDGKKKFASWASDSLADELLGMMEVGPPEVLQDLFQKFRDTDVTDDEWIAIKDRLNILEGLIETGSYSDISLTRIKNLRYLVDVWSNARTYHGSAVALMQDVLASHCVALKNVQRIADDSIENSMKVYDFVKSVADKHLGKTFLVRLPKTTNLSYNKHLTIKDGNLFVHEYDKGPFGFQPRPINSEAGYFYNQTFQDILNGLADNKGKYSNGALKNNYNPMSDMWEFNYMPEPQGGFFEHGLYGNVFRPQDLADMAPDKLPLGTLQHLCPKDLTNFVGDNGRISCYAKFEQSQFLNFVGVGTDSFTQEVMTPHGFMPDVALELDNLKEEEVKFHSFDVSDKLKALPKSSAFVKCEVDEQLYMPPVVTSGNDIVFGQEVVDIGGIKPPRKIWSEEKCKMMDSFTYWDATFIPDPENGGSGIDVMQEDFMRQYNPTLQGDIIVTNTQALDSGSVYALITLPGKITSTIDSRMKDGPYQMGQPVLMKHLLTMDTVKGVVGFDKPAVRGKVENYLQQACAAASPDALSNSFSAYQQAMSKVGVASAEARLHFAAPSPIYPDMVALPLLSKDRCYGPWISSQVNLDAARLATMDLGGKVEFIKDENLAPWNYDGYQLMNDAGSLQAQFSNGLMLFSERGGFVFPGVPEGNTLCQPLLTGGPLVTNITVDVGPGGVKTTYKMDLYTPRFGKLQVQKEKAIAQITRERQKLTDQRNTMIRKGIGKAATSKNYSAVMAQFNDVVNAAQSSSKLLGELER